MAKITDNNTFQRLQSKYRLVVMNDDTYEEIVTFKLSRLSVYIGLSTVFVLLVGFTIALIVFTPLKYYVPGYGNKENAAQLRTLKARTDSLETAIHYKDQYLDGIKKILNGDTNVKLDTTSVAVPKQEISND